MIKVADKRRKEVRSKKKIQNIILGSLLFGIWFLVLVLWGLGEVRY